MYFKIIYFLFLLIYFQIKEIKCFSNVTIKTTNSSKSSSKESSTSLPLSSSELSSTKLSGKKASTIKEWSDSIKLHSLNGELSVKPEPNRDVRSVGIILIMDSEVVDESFLTNTFVFLNKRLKDFGILVYIYGLGSSLPLDPAAFREVGLNDATQNFTNIIAKPLNYSVMFVFGFMKIPDNEAHATGTLCSAPNRSFWPYKGKYPSSSLLAMILLALSAHIGSCNCYQTKDCHDLGSLDYDTMSSEAKSCLRTNLRAHRSSKHSCLRKFPSVVAKAICGNSIVEDQEYCDCSLEPKTCPLDCSVSDCTQYPEKSTGLLSPSIRLYMIAAILIAVICYFSLTTHNKTIIVTSQLVDNKNDLFFKGPYKEMPYQIIEEKSKFVKKLEIKSDTELGVKTSTEHVKKSVSSSKITGTKSTVPKSPSTTSEFAGRSPELKILKSLVPGANIKKTKLKMAKSSGVCKKVKEAKLAAAALVGTSLTGNKLLFSKSKNVLLSKSSAKIQVGSKTSSMESSKSKTIPSEVKATAKKSNSKILPENKT